jgi:hypothetical protein
MSCRRAALPILLLLLAGCSGEPEAQLPVEVVTPAPLQLSLETDGQSRAVKAMPLLVPGKQWSQRQLIWMKPDGSRVEAGELVARFVTAQGQLELDKALLDLQRNLLARSAKEDELQSLQGRVEVDLGQVGIDLAIARRYADADLAMFARNEILDAVQDQQFLGEKRGVLEWRRDQASGRGQAELGVLDSQRDSFDLNAQTRRQDLDALELRAPNAGVLVHVADWTGEKPKLGASMWAGLEFASLPDPSQLEVELLLPQLEAQGIVEGVEIEVHPVGRPEQSVRSRISWIASAAAVRSRGNPVKYLRMRATLPQDESLRHGWVPGQAFQARILVARAETAISVPNVALGSEGGRSHVHVRRGDGWERRDITLGARGPARSQVLDGLQAGDVVLLTPAAATGGDA